MDMEDEDEAESEDSEGEEEECSSDTDDDEDCEQMLETFYQGLKAKKKLMAGGFKGGEEEKERLLQRVRQRRSLGRRLGVSRGHCRTNTLVCETCGKSCGITADCKDEIDAVMFGDDHGSVLAQMDGNALVLGRIRIQIRGEKTW